MSEPLAYTVKEAEHVTGLSRTTLWRLVTANQLVARRIGRRVLYTRASIEAVLRRDHAIPSDEQIKELCAKKHAKNADATSPRAASSQKRRGAR
jgi:excisionase family DNA binding protein